MDQAGGGGGLWGGSDANDTARHTAPRVARGQGQLVATLAQVVHVRVHHNGPPNDGGRADDLHQPVLDVDAGDAVSSGLDVPWA